MTIEIIVFIVFTLSFFVLAFISNDHHIKIKILESRLNAINGHYYEWPQKGQVSSSDQGIFLQPIGSHDSNPFDPPYKEIQNEHKHKWILFSAANFETCEVEIFAECDEIKCRKKLNEEEIQSRLNEYDHLRDVLRRFSINGGLSINGATCADIAKETLDRIIKKEKELRERDETLQYLKQYPPNEFN